MASKKTSKNRNDSQPAVAEAHEHVHDMDHVSGGHAQHQEEGEPWLVSYADMMTLLFGFFVVMYALAVASPKNEECVRLKLMDAFRTDSAAAGDVADEAAQNAAMRALEMLVTMLNLESIEDVILKIQEAEARAKDGEGEVADSRDKKEKLHADDLKALMGADEIKDTVIISVPVDVIFDSGSTTLLPTAIPKLKNIALTIGRITNVDKIQVVGHTDSSTNDTTGKLESWSLSVMRASAVAKVLTANSVSSKLVRVEGRGSAEPLLPEKKSDGQWIRENMSKNRRIEILVNKDRKNAR
jgi:chemotaxis protein MotB